MVCIVDLFAAIVLQVSLLGASCPSCKDWPHPQRGCLYIEASPKPSQHDRFQCAKHKSSEQHNGYNGNGHRHSPDDNPLCIPVTAGTYPIVVVVDSCSEPIRLNGELNELKLIGYSPKNENTQVLLVLPVLPVATISFCNEV